MPGFRITITAWFLSVSSHQLTAKAKDASCFLMCPSGSHLRTLPLTHTLIGGVCEFLAWPEGGHRKCSLPRKPLDGGCMICKWMKPPPRRISISLMWSLKARWLRRGTVDQSGIDLHPQTATIISPTPLWLKKGIAIAENRLKFPENHQPYEMFYDVESYPMLVDRVTFEEGHKMNGDELKFFDSTGWYSWRQNSWLWLCKSDLWHWNFQIKALLRTLLTSQSFAHRFTEYEILMSS